MERNPEPNKEESRSWAEAILKSYAFSGNSELRPGFKLHEYVGPVQFYKTESVVKGYGLRATKAVKCGEILLISRSVASCLRYYELRRRVPSEPSASSSEPPADETVKDVMVKSGRVPAEVSEQLLLAVREWATDKNKASAILYLDNAHYSRPVNFPEVDDINLGIFRNEDQYSTPGHPYARPGQPLSSFLKRMLFDTDRWLEGAFLKNASYDDVKWRELHEDGGHGAEQQAEFWGLWLIPSFINHSCTPNCTRQRVGDYLVIRAATQLAENDELSLPYFDVFKPVSVRDRFSKMWGFKCSCARCALEDRDEDPELADLDDRFILTYRQLENAWHDKRIPIDVVEQNLEEMTSLTWEIDDKIDRMGLRVHEAAGAADEENQRAPDSTAGTEATSKNAEGKFDVELKSDPDLDLQRSELEAEAAGEAKRDVSSSSQKGKARVSGKKARKAAKEKAKEEAKLMQAEATKKRADERDRRRKKKADVEDRLAQENWEHQWELAEEVVRLHFVQAGEDDPTLLTKHHWGHHSVNPITQLRRNLKADRALKDMADNIHAYQMRASFLDAYVATYTIQTNSEDATNSDKIVSTFGTIITLLDLLKTVIATTGWNDHLANKFFVSMHKSVAQLGRCLSENAYPVVRALNWETRDLGEVLAKAYYGETSRELADFFMTTFGK